MKKFNLLGFLLVLSYVFIFLLLVILGSMLGISLKSADGWRISGIIYSIAVFWMCSWIRIIPITLYKTRFNMLADKYAKATLVSKGNHHTTRGLTVHKHTVLYTVLTFTLSDGTRLSFEVKPAVFHIFLENDVGTLVYRQYGKKTFFVDFDIQ